jgi:hypothetical protein
MIAGTMQNRAWPWALAVLAGSALGLGAALAGPNLSGPNLSGPVAMPAAAAAPGPLRAGRLVDFQGGVWLFDTEQGQWSEALRNRALTEGDRISTQRGAQAQVRVGSTELRLGPAAELEIMRMDDARMSFRLHRGSLAVRVRSLEMAAEVDVLTTEGRLQPERAGSYRLDREDDITWVSVWRGAGQVQTADQRFAVTAGQRVELSRLGRDQGTLVTWSSAVQDRFAEGVAAEEERDGRSASLRYVSPEMTGAEDLDRHGRWYRHPEYGMVWAPLTVAADWAPFQHGRWIWHARWGWTWVDRAPWGFAPFHYGRWVLWDSRWVWMPGAWVARPAFAPALVSFTGPSIGISLVLGPSRPPVHWVPLPPWDKPHRPWHHHLPGSIDPPRQVHPGAGPAPLPPAASVIPRPPGGGKVALPERRHVPGSGVLRPGAVVTYTEGRSRETDDVPTLTVPPSPPRTPEGPRAPRAATPPELTMPSGLPRPVTESRSPVRPDLGAGRGDRQGRAERQDRDMGQRSERPARPAPAEPAEAAQERGRSATEHRPRDQRERAQML